MADANTADSGFVNLGFARVDTDRKRRCGFPEVIFGAGKTPVEVLAIAREILSREPVLLVSRANSEQRTVVEAEWPIAKWHERAKCLTIEREPLPKRRGTIAVVCAG